MLAGVAPSAGEVPKLLLRILTTGVTTALVYTAIAMAVSSLTTRRAAAAVGIVLAIFVPVSVVRSAIESGAPDELDLLNAPFVASDLAYRIFGETSEDIEPVTNLATWMLVAALAAAVLIGVAVCALRYRRMEAFR